MKTKCFSVGQTAYIKEDGRARGEGIKIVEEKVVKVGRKYVTTVDICSGVESRFEETRDGCRHLKGINDNWKIRTLFAGKSDIDEHIERLEITNWINRKTKWADYGEYTLSQMREIKKILENPGGRNDKKN